MAVLVHGERTMNEYECYVNGQRIVVSNNLDAVSKKWYVEDVLKHKPVEGSLDFDIKLYPLWKQQRN